MPSRQVGDFVDGGRARREEWRQQQLALQQMREAENLTFKPQIFTKDAYSHVSFKPTIECAVQCASMRSESHAARL